METDGRVVIGDLALRLRNTAASATIVSLACAAYSFAPFHQHALRTLYGPPAIAFTGQFFLVCAAGVYIVLLAAYLMTEPHPGV